MIKFYNKEKSDDKTKSLAQALQASRTTRSASITPYQTTQGAKGDSGTSTLEGTGDFLNGASGLVRTLGNSGLFGSGSANSGGNGIFSSAINDNIFGSGNNYGAVSSAIDSNVMGSGGSDSVLSGAISKNVGSSGGGSGGSVPWAAIGKAAKTGYNGFSGKTDGDYSDTEETIIYPLQGASMGAQFGPWGALGGALYGLGYSFKDDLGLEDNDWLTDLVFPIGMGDEHYGLIQL